MALTIFTIEMLPHNRTLYKLCGRYNYTSRATGPSLGEGKMFVTDSQNSGSDQDQTDSEELVVDVTCDSQDAKGHYIFIRDDRKKVDYFRICEVEVFEFDKRGNAVVISSGVREYLDVQWTLTVDLPNCRPAPS